MIIMDILVYPHPLEKHSLCFCCFVFVTKHNILERPDSPKGKFVCNAGDQGLIPGSGRSSGEGNGNPLQYSCLQNPMNREAWWASVHGVTVAHNWVTNTHTHTHTHTHNITRIYPCAAAAAKSLQSCPTLCDPIGGSCVHTISNRYFVEREWVSYLFIQ